MHGHMLLLSDIIELPKSASLQQRWPVKKAHGKKSYKGSL